MGRYFILFFPVVYFFNFFKKTRQLAPRVAWGLWHFGDRGARIRPYKMFNPRVDMRGGNKTSYSKLNFVMSRLPEPTQDATVGADGAFVGITAWEAVDAQIAELLTQAYPDGVPRRATSVSYVTLYDRLASLRTQGVRVRPRQRRRLLPGVAGDDPDGQEANTEDEE
jgi:hypothetical protein